MSLVSRQISPIITLASDAGTSFNGNDTAKYDGLRVRVTISKGGTPQLDRAEVRIWGMPLSDMNAVSRLGKPLTWTRNNIITLQAGDADAGMSQIFTGFMYSAYVDFEPPEASLNIMAISNLGMLTAPITPSSFPGNASIDTIIQAIGAKMTPPLGTQNSGVNWQVQNAYYTGSAKEQMDKVAAAANCQWIPNGGAAGNLLEVWPKGQGRSDSSITIGPNETHQLVGYPTYQDVGVLLRVLYAPGIGYGQTFTLKSSVLETSQWYVLSQTLDLGCNDPDGDNPWFSEISATLKNGTFDTALAAVGNITSGPF